MKNRLRCVLLLWVLCGSCAAQELAENVKERVAALQEKFLASQQKQGTGRAMVYEFSRSKDDLKLIAELHTDKKGEQALLRIYRKGGGASSYFYSNIGLKTSRMLMLTEADKNGVEMNGISNLMAVLMACSDLIPSDQQERAVDADKQQFFIAINLYLEANNIVSSLGISTRFQLTWKALAEGVSEVTETENYYKFSRKMHHGYFLVDKVNGALVEQRETRDGQVRKMKLISNKAWHGNVAELLPDYSDFTIERVDLREKMVNGMAAGMMQKLLKAMIEDDSLAIELAKNPTNINQKMVNSYVAMWKQDEHFLLVPAAWKVANQQFINATKLWKAKESLVWKKKPRKVALNELLKRYFPQQDKGVIEQLFEGVTEDMKLDAESRKRKGVIQKSISSALYQAWSQVQIETFLDSL